MSIQGSPFKRNAEEDDSDSNSPKKTKIELTKEEDHISQFFYEALQIINKTMKVSDDEISNGIRTVQKSFLFDEGNRWWDIDFNKSENLYAYFNSYSQVYTEVSRRRILDAVKKCPLLQDVLKKEEINVVSIGGGPGCDIIGMLSAWYETVNCKKLNLTVVDIVERWKSFLNIVEFLLREGDFGNACKMFKKSNASLSFICKDVTKVDSQETAYSEAVNKADVILMQRLFASLSLKGIDKVAVDVTQKMKTGALLFFLEIPKQFYDFGALGLEKIYEEEHQNFYAQGNTDKYFEHSAPHTYTQVVVYRKSVVKHV